MKSLCKKILEVYRLKWGNGIKKSRKAKVLNSNLGPFTHVADYAMLFNAEVGSYSSVGRFTTARDVEIGKFCAISWNVTIGATSHFLDHVSTHAFPYIKSFNFVEKDRRIKVLTQIGNDVWIGANAIIMPGVQVGDGAVVGAGAIVTKDVEPYQIVVGVPAKPLKYRFDPEIIERFKRLKWWDLDKEVIKSNINLFNRQVSLDTLLKLEEICR